MVGVLTWAGVAFCGALGAVARFRVDSAISARLPSDFPAGTLAVNLTGSFALGVLVGASASHRLTLLLGVGFMGGYTTFSTFQIETFEFARDGHVALAIGYPAASIVAGMTLAVAGVMLARWGRHW